MMGEDTEPPENILVKDRIACFPNKWESDLSPEIPDLEQLTAQARDEMGLKEDAGKPLIARYIARQLTSRTPPVVPPSLKGIIEKAVVVKWEKSCLAVKEVEKKS